MLRLLAAAADELAIAFLLLVTTLTLVDCVVVFLVLVFFFVVVVFLLVVARLTRPAAGSARGTSCSRRLTTSNRSVSTTLLNRSVSTTPPKGLTGLGRAATLGARRAARPSVAERNLEGAEMIMASPRR